MDLFFWIKTIYRLIMWQFKIIGMIIGGLFMFFQWLGRLSPPKQETKEISFESRFEHTFICAGSGHGKTQLIQHMVLTDLPCVLDKKWSVVVIDSQGI